MTTKHTPGPWHVKKWKGGIYADGFEYAVTDNRGWGIATLCQKGNKPKAKANADIMAAAPDLLDALKQCWHFIENVPDDAPDRTERFFDLREKVRDTFDKALGK